MSLSLSGTLKDPFGNNLASCVIEFIAKQTSSAVLKGINASVKTDQDGQYAITVQYGMYDIYVSLAQAQQSRTLLVSSMLIDSSLAVTNINDLIIQGVGEVEAIALITEFRKILVDIKDEKSVIEGIFGNAQDISDARDTSVSAANQADVHRQASANSEANAEAWATASADSANQADAHQQAAAASATQADAHRQASANSEASAEASASASAASANQADAHQQAAAASATSANQHKQAASESATQANAHQQAASESANQANQHRQAAATSEANAQQWAQEAQQATKNLLDDTQTSTTKAWSSDKVSTELDQKADKSEVFSGSYNDLEGIPTEFTPTDHNHDDLYYTKAEVDSQLQGVGGGDLVKIQAITIAEGTSFIDVSADPDEYISLKIFAENIRGDITGRSIMMQTLRPDLTPYTEDRYRQTTFRTSSTLLDRIISQPAIAMAGRWAVNATVTAIIEVPISTNIRNSMLVEWSASAYANNITEKGIAALFNQSLPTSGLRLFPSEGTFTVGTIIVYGVKR